MSIGTQVAPGTPCAPCKANGHHCPAQEIDDGRAVCLHCLDGVPCPRTPRNGTHSTVTAAPATGACSRGCGRPTHRGNCSAIAPKPVTAAVAKPQPQVGPLLCRQGCGKPRHVGRCKGAMPVRKVEVQHPVAQAEGMVTKSKEIFGELEAEHAVFSPREAAALAKRAEQMTKSIGQKDVAGAAVPALSAKSIAAGYELVALDDVPGRRPLSVYEGIVDDLAKLPVNAPVKRTLANEGIAHTFMCGITRVARTRGLKVSQVQNGATIYLWLREKAGK